MIKPAGILLVRRIALSCIIRDDTKKFGGASCGFVRMFILYLITQINDLYLHFEDRLSFVLKHLLRRVPKY